MTVAAPPGAKRLPILVVDDNPSALYATSRVLKAAGFDVLEATTGGSALQQAAQAQLVVLDINLPDMDGYEVCRRLRADPPTRDLPVLHLSATFTGEKDFNTGLKAGADGYLTRPVEPAVLVAIVRTMLFARSAEQVRRATDARFRTVFEHAPTAIALLDARQHVESVNPAFCELLGMPAREIVGRSLDSFGVAGEEALSARILAGADPSGHWTGSSAMLRIDGGTVVVEWRVAFLPDSPTRMLQGIDITHRLRAQEERERLLAAERAARSDAERSNRQKDEFLATLSHELRNPLNAILGWTAVLRRAEGLKPSVVQGLDAIERNSRLQGQLIGDLLDYAGIRFGKLRVVRELIDPHVPLRAALAVSQATAHERGVDLALELTAEEVALFADPARIQQIAWNLVSNALKFTDRGGRVQVRTAVEPEYFVLEVIDSGKGISPEFLPNLFDRFSQEDASTTRRHGGLGLGLAIVRSLVQIQQGTITAHSDGIGRGARFAVRLPRSSEPSSALPSSAGGDNSLLQNADLLVVEDDADTRHLLKRILEEAGARVTGVASADAAEQALESTTPDLLISDIGMAERDGYELIRSVRASGLSVDRLPAIALTAFVREQDRQSALAAGFQLHLPKPVDPDELVRMVATLLASRLQP